MLGFCAVLSCPGPGDCSTVARAATPTAAARWGPRLWGVRQGGVRLTPGLVDLNRVRLHWMNLTQHGPELITPSQSAYPSLKLIPGRRKICTTQLWLALPFLCYAMAHSHADLLLYTPPCPAAQAQQQPPVVLSESSSRSIEVS